MISPIVMHPLISTTFKQLLSDGTSMEMEVYFLAMDTDKDVKKLLSLETTWIFLNEAKQLPYSVVKAARERIGRYPAVIDGYTDVYKADELVYQAPRDEHGNYAPCRRKALIMDTNPPEDDHWWYQLAEEGCLRKTKNKDQSIKETSRIFDFFRGPSPLIELPDGTYKPNPKAENIPYLPGGYQYYLDMIAGNTEDHINVMVMGNYGAIKEGRPVYPQYSDRMHCPEKGVNIIRGLPIALGWDFGLTPAVVIGQLTDRGQARIVLELVAEDMSVREFARDVVKPVIQRVFKDFEIAFSFGDPAGNNRGEGEGKTSIGILNDDYVVDGDEPLSMGFDTEPAPTNDPTQRIDSVIGFLIKLVDGEPGYVLDKSCDQLRKGKNGGYHYKRVAIAGSEERYRDKPDKNRYSHPSDAEQYLMLGFAGGYVCDSSEQDDYDDEYHGDDTNAMGY
jgi:hypothetical protein